MVSQILSLGLLSTLVSVSFAQQYGSAFANCIALADVPTAGAYLIAQGRPYFTPATCIQACTRVGFSYAYLTTSASTSTSPTLYAGYPECICSYTQPEASWVTSTISSTDDMNCTSSTDYQAYKLSTTEQFQGCVDSAQDVQPVYANTVDTYQECLTQCASYPYLYMAALPSSNTWDCICESGLANPDYSACGYVAGTSQRYLVYYHDPIAQASLLTKRKLRERLLDERNKQIADCPKGLTACSVVGSPDSFECIDTRSEFESCGGCLDGVYGYPSSVNVTGTDCSSLPGAALDATTCNDGRCEIFACLDDYSLVDGQCVSD